MTESNSSHGQHRCAARIDDDFCVDRSSPELARQSVRRPVADDRDAYANRQTTSPRAGARRNVDRITGDCRVDRSVDDGVNVAVAAGGGGVGSLGPQRGRKCAG